MIAVTLAVLIGLGLGFVFGDYIHFDVSFLIQGGLYLLLFFVGMDLGQNTNLMEQLKKLSYKILLLPFLTMLASLFGGFLAAYVLSISVAEAVAIASGMGWYSFSAIELSKVSAELGGVAFLANIFRELFAIMLIPVLSKKVSSFSAIAISGATAMDTVLPIINKNNPAEISIVSFYSGLVVSMSVPILVPFVVSIFGLG